MCFVLLFQNHRNPGYYSGSLWPVCCQGSIIIHLQDIRNLSPGQQYIYFKRSTGGQIHLALKYYSNYGLQDVILRNNCEIGNTLNMEWSNRFKMRSDDDLGKLLQRTMSTFEDSIQRIKLEDVADSCRDCKRNRQMTDNSVKRFQSTVTNRPKFMNRTGNNNVLVLLFSGITFIYY